MNMHKFCQVNQFQGVQICFPKNFETEEQPNE